MEKRALLSFETSEETDPGTQNDISEILDHEMVGFF